MCQSCLRSKKLVLRNKSYQMSLMNLPDVDYMNQIMPLNHVFMNESVTNSLFTPKCIHLKLRVAHFFYYKRLYLYLQIFDIVT